MLQKNLPQYNIYSPNERGGDYLIEDSFRQIRPDIIIEFDGKIIAGNLLRFDKNMAVYVHGASSNQYRNLMPAYLLQWSAILKAKSLGIKYYDFWGVNVNNRNPKWAGISRFKFNGYIKYANNRKLF